MHHFSMRNSWMLMIKIFVFNSLRLVYDCCSKNLLPFQFQISDLNYQSDTKDKHHTLKKKKKKLELSFIKVNSAIGKLFQTSK